MGRALLARLLETKSGAVHWRALGRLAPTGRDRVDVEAVVEALRRLGWVALATRRDRRGERHPVRVVLTDAGRTAAAALLAPSPAPTAPIAERLAAALRALVDQPEALPIPARVLIQQVLGHTKAVRLSEYRDAIETILGLPLDRLVRDHATAVLVAGPLTYRYRGYTVDARMSHPWLAIPEPVVKSLDSLEPGADEILTVENLTPFEELSWRTPTAPPVRVFTSGFLGRVEQTLLRRLLTHPRVKTLRHWGDLDPGGLYIYRTLHRLATAAAPAVEVHPHEMHPDRLTHPAATPLTETDRTRLRAYLADPTNPLRPLAEAMLESNRKLEQEALI